MLKPRHFARYAEIIRLLWKHGRRDFVEESQLATTVGYTPKSGDDSGGNSKPEEFASDLERLGPVFIKLGQLLSTRADLLPQAYLDPLAKLQDNVDPVPHEEIEEIVCEELGVRLSRGFSEFSEEPLATASLGQVHRATLRDGRQVAVKVQRPGVRKQVIQDLDALTDLAEFLDSHSKTAKESGLKDIVTTLESTLLRELDYRQEAENAIQLQKNLVEYPNIVIPVPIHDYFSSRVLTTEFVPGTKITELSGVILTEIDGSGLASEIFNAYLHQVLVDGFFHSDPHPGNLSLTDDRRVALMDFGMVTSVSPDLRQELLKLLLAVSEVKGEQAARVAIKIGTLDDDFSESDFITEISNIISIHANKPVEQLQSGQIVMEIQKVAGTCGLHLPQEVTMLGKTLLNLDRVVEALDPNFNPNDALRERASQMLEEQMKSRVTLNTLFNSILETTDLAQSLPERINRFTELVANNSLSVKVNAIDETRLMMGFQKVANRISTGLVLAALIIGASMLMHLESSLTLFGYPAIALVFFLIAATTGSLMVIQAVFTDKSK